MQCCYLARRRHFSPHFLQAGGQGFEFPSLHHAKIGTFGPCDEGGDAVMVDTRKPLDTLTRAIEVALDSGVTKSEIHKPGGHGQRAIDEQWTHC